MTETTAPAALVAAEAAPKAEKKIIYLKPKHILSKVYKVLEFAGEWLELIGKPSLVFHTILYGLAKSGKSTACLKFAEYLTNFGEVMYVSGEEGFSYSLRLRIERLGIVSDKISFIKEKKLSRIKTAIKNKCPRFVFIDSAHYVNMSPPQFEQLKETFKNTSFIIILQATKEGNFKGDTAWEHNVDVVIEVAKGVCKSRGRFNAGGRMNLFAPPKPAQQTLGI